jgi:dipeptidyl aminopeptidase/acylaminoacyl peptidase
MTFSSHWRAQLNLPRLVTLALLCWVHVACGQVSAVRTLELGNALSPVGATQATISPDGANVAVVERTGPRTKRVTLISTADLSTRVVIDNSEAPRGSNASMRVPQRVTWITSSLIAVDYGHLAQAHDLTGKFVSDLSVRVIGKAVPADHESPLVLVFDNSQLDELAVMNAKTGRSQKLRYPMSGHLQSWAVDELGQLRAVLLSDSPFWRDDTTLTHWYLPPGSEEWQALEHFKPNEESFEVIRASSSKRELIVRSRHGRDTYAVFTYDTEQRRLAQVLAEHPNEDVAAQLEPGTGKLRRIVSHGMKPRQIWLDEDWTDVQVAVDQALPGRINWLSGNPLGRVLVYSHSDVDAGRWLLLDVPKTLLRLLAVRLPNLEKVTLRPVEIFSYPALDGLAIPAYLTRPAGAARPRPTVVMVHGGPATRDEWGWDLESQLLAAQGYVVLRPQFRGSSGFGRAFEVAGHRQWGMAMQDDITAGVKALIERGIADPSSICIYGASYGGYAAVWGLIKTPELFRCGVTLAGVSDLELMLNDWSDSNRDKLTRQILLHRIGDREQDKAQFAQVSPLKQAHRIQAPLLIAHGDDDVRVPMTHAKKLKSAMDKAGKTYQWLPLYDEGHGTTTLAGQRTFLDALLRFLKEHIGSNAPD